ncbi:MAG TPA: large conductance mechanosensitive channel protein MscL [Bacilli bacterium]|nr:large conductance mechanosensitive channel protein MscL [Bacilli bacterium]
MIKEFKKFISKGNVIDLSVGIIIGTAFTKIVNSIVNDMIMPVIGVLTAGIDFADIKISLVPIARALGNKKIPDGGINMSLGLFINAVIEFLIIGFTVFLLIKFINKSKEKLEAITDKKEKVKEEKAKKPDDILLLEEIRNILKKKK